MSKTRVFGELLVVPFIIAFVWMYCTNFFMHWKSLSFDLGSLLLVVIVAWIIPLCFLIGFLELREEVFWELGIGNKLSQIISGFSIVAGYISYLILFIL
jgi:hypothetical protein